MWSMDRNRDVADKDGTGVAVLLQDQRSSYLDYIYIYIYIKIHIYRYKDIYRYIKRYI